MLRCKISLIVALVLLLSSTASAQVRRALITQAIDTTKLATLRGNTRAEAVSANDRGLLADSTPLNHLVLQLRRPAETEAALALFMAQQHDPKSPNFHHWLTPAQLATQFGPSPSDVAAVTSWLKSQGFAVDSTDRSQMRVNFSGNAGQVRTGFHTEIHHLQAGGAAHIANMSDPQVPTALAPAIVGVSSLNDFFPHPMLQPSYGSTGSMIVPVDLWTIYNFQPAFTAGYTGQGQTITVFEDADLWNTTDWPNFRSLFDLSRYTYGSITQAQPGGCGDPGTGSDSKESGIDAQWASAAAPNANIVVAACANVGATSGVQIAMQNVLAASPAGIWSISFGQSETVDGAALNATWNSIYQEAAAAGVSVFVAAGDNGAALNDEETGGRTIGASIMGIGVNGLASTPYNVAVGGTDFGDKYAGTTSTYWNATNGTYFNSAKSYIPEIPWNTSCASTLLASYNSYSQTYGAAGYCNHGGPLTDIAGSGGPSGCATGGFSSAYVVGGSCAGYAKPSWQSIVGNPSDGVRDLPDVAMFAGNGTWGHSYCYFFGYTTGAGVAGCYSGGGTSFGAPIWAGIQALINQKTGTTWGNPAPEYYALASTEYGGGGDSACNSTLGNAVSSSCIFYDVTQGDVDVPCQPYSTGTSYDCYQP